MSEQPEGSPTQTTPAVALEERGHAAIVRLERPAERNPLSSTTLDELERTLDALVSRAGDFRAIILAGSGGAFASGANIRELAALDAVGAREFARRGQRVMRKVAGAPQLTVAAVDGYCMGGGLDLALSCDLRVASPQSVFAHPGARLGVITGWGGTQRLARLIGEARAFEMFLTARRLTAAEAFEAGLVNRLSEDPTGCALELAAALDRPPAAFDKKGDEV
ncbi:MAG TPA: enoyl-CoA hydratase/isomerase family protein [Pyrinomonadaceae bacterium]|nr:enoyl-CoA hydratase/isomerase family protein [Pyrinomonadaceae bacterium]